MQIKRKLLLVICAAALTITGSGAATASASEAGVAGWVTDKLNTFHDATGRVTVSVFWTEGGDARSHWDETIYPSDPDMLAIGGGAVASNQGYGSLLTKSRPTDDMSGWSVAAKDHQAASPFKLKAYVIGLKIAGMSKDQLRHDQNVINRSNISGVASHPEAEVGVPSEQYEMVGGGFEVISHGWGSMATASFPSSQFTWKARSKDHLHSDPAQIRTWAIGIKRDLPVGRIDAAYDDNGSSTSAHPASTAEPPVGYALTGGGGEVHYSGAGNMLWALQPATGNSSSFTAASKDHIVSDPTSITAYAWGIRFI
ncbi:hypothetical protein [Amycolatopsis sp. lyj-108]|uniref:hypothetical protein n=1 Tax=Amycolatopsis sp. lyj-108 TaxID=2789286 RepID=UPI003978FE76